MFKTAFKLPFRLAGIPVYLDLSFLFAFPLMVWMMFGNLHAAAAHFGLSAAPLSTATTVILAIFIVAGMFASIVLHELGHSLTARAYGVSVRRITLWFLGGVAEFAEMPRQRGAEAVVAMAGPMVSFALAGIFFVAATLATSVETIWLVCFFLAVINLTLAIFNLIPAMPMDGGRILRSLLALAMPHPRATAIAGVVAKGIAVCIGVIGLGLVNYQAGVFTMGLGAAPWNPWMIFLAFFIYSSATRETRFAQGQSASAVDVAPISSPASRSFSRADPAGFRSPPAVGPSPWYFGR